MRRAIEDVNGRILAGRCIALIDCGASASSRITSEVLQGTALQALSILQDGEAVRGQWSEVRLPSRKYVLICDMRHFKRSVRDGDRASRTKRLKCTNTAFK